MLGCLLLFHGQALVLGTGHYYYNILLRHVSIAGMLFHDSLLYFD
jgi:hypothetical protein